MCHDLNLKILCPVWLARTRAIVSSRELGEKMKYKGSHDNELYAFSRFRQEIRDIM